jgi:hypothetical protein
MTDNRTIWKIERWKHENRDFSAISVSLITSDNESYVKQQESPQL